MSRGLKEVKEPAHGLSGGRNVFDGETSKCKVPHIGVCAGRDVLGILE